MQQYRELNELLNTFNTKKPGSKSSFFKRRQQFDDGLGESSHRIFNEQMSAMQYETSLMEKKFSFLWVMAKASQCVQFKQEGQEVIEQMYNDHKNFPPTIRRTQLHQFINRYENYNLPIKLLISTDIIMGEHEGEQHSDEHLKAIFAYSLPKRDYYLIRDVVFKFENKHLDQDLDKYQEEQERVMVKLEELGYLRSRLSYNKRFNCVFSFREVLAREKVFVEESRFTSPNFLALDQSNRSRLNNVLFSKRANLTEATKLRGNQRLLHAHKQFCDFVQLDQKIYIRNMKQRQAQQQNKDNPINWSKTDHDWSEILKRYRDLIPYYLRDNSSMDALDNEQKKVFYAKILSFYVENSMIFRTVNGVCRSASCREDFLRVGIYCKYLFEAIMYLHKNVSIDMTLYHGGYSSQEERDLWEQGTYLYNLNFMSTSKQRKVALKFSKMDSYRHELGQSVIIQLKINKCYRDMKSKYSEYLSGFIDINSVLPNQKFEDQKQVLFNMFNVFRVESVTPSEDDSKTTKVVLLYCGHRDIFFNRAAGVQLSRSDEYVFNKILNMSQYIDHGVILRNQGKVEEVITYFSDLVNEGNVLVMEENQNLIRALVETGQHEKAKDYLCRLAEQIQDVVEQEIKAAQVCIALEDEVTAEQRLLKSQGLLRKSQQQGHKSAIELLKFNLQCNQIQFALGKRCIAKGDYQQALTKFLKVADSLNKETLLSEVLVFRRELIAVSQFIKHQQYEYQLRYQYLKFSADSKPNLQDFFRTHQFHELVAIQSQQIETIFQKFNMWECRYFLIFAQQQANQKYQEESSRYTAEGIQFADLAEQFCEVKNVMLKSLQKLNSCYEMIYEVYMAQQRREQLKEHLLQKKIFYDRMQNLMRGQKNSVEKSLFLKSSGSFYWEYNQMIEDGQEGVMHQSGIKARNSLKEAESILERINENHVDLPGILTKSEIIQHYKALPQQIEKRMSLMSTEVHSKELQEQLYSIDESVQESTYASQKKTADKIIKIHSNNKAVLKELTTMTSKLGIMADWAYETRSKINSTFTDMGEAKKLKSTIVKETKSLNLTWHSFYAQFWYFASFLSYCESNLTEALQSAKRCQQFLMLRYTQQPNPQLKEKEKSIYMNSKVIIKLRSLQAKILQDFSCPTLRFDCLNHLQMQIKFIEEKIFTNSLELPQLYESRGALLRTMVFYGNADEINPLHLQDATKYYERAIIIRQKNQTKQNLPNAKIFVILYYLYLNGFNWPQKAEQMYNRAIGIFKRFQATSFEDLQADRKLIEIDHLLAQHSQEVSSALICKKYREILDRLNQKKYFTFEDLYKKFLFAQYLAEKAYINDSKMQLISLFEDLKRRQQILRNSLEGEYPHWFSCTSCRLFQLLLQVIDLEMDIANGLGDSQTMDRCEYYKKMYKEIFKAKKRKNDTSKGNSDPQWLFITKMHHKISAANSSSSKNK